MLTLTRKTDYALVALTYLGQRYLEGTGPASAKQIAEQFDLPSPLLMNVLKELAHAKLVHATRGVHGGYELASPPGRTTVLEVITAVEGPLQFATCTDAAQGMHIVGQGCSIEATCPIRSPIHKLHQRIACVFRDVTLQDLMEDDIANACACQTVACAPR